MKKHNVNGKEYLMKDMDDWKSDFNNDFLPGDYVTQEIIEYFRDVLPPRSMKPGYLQVGEPFSHVPDEEGRYKATYNTFIKEDEVWKYVGHCFEGKTEHKN